MTTDPARIVPAGPSSPLGGDIVLSIDAMGGDRGIGDVDVVDGAGNLSSFEFDELEVFIVLYDILDGGGDVAAVFKGDETGALKDEEGAAAVGRVVRDGDFRAVCKIFQIFNFAGVNAHRFDMDFGDGF